MEKTGEGDKEKVGTGLGCTRKLGSVRGIREHGGEPQQGVETRLLLSIRPSSL